MSENPFDGPRSVLARAREHVDELSAKGKAFAEKKPFASFCELDIPTAKYFYGFRLTENPPDSLSTIAKDALNNLRDVLDLALSASVRMLDPSVTVDELNGISFPFADKEEHFQGALKKGCEKVHPEIRALVASFKPYRAGNEPLYVMNLLAKTNRHRVLQPILFASENKVGITFMGGTDFSVGPFGWESGKNKIVIIKAGNPNVKYDVTISLHVAFGDIEIVRGDPAVPVIYGFAGIVEGILVAIEAETRRILVSRS